MVPFVLIISFIQLIPLFIGAFIALFIWKNRRIMQGNRSIIFLSGILLGESLYSATYSNELLLTDPSLFLILAFFRYSGMLVFLFSLICFSCWYVGFWNHTSKYLIALISIPGIMSLVILASNNYHHLFYPSINHIPGEIPHFVHTNGILYLPVQIYAILLLFGIVLVLIYWMISSPRLYGPVVWLILIGAFSPLVGLLLYHLGIRPYGFVNLVPFSLIITAVSFTVALVKYRLYSLKPIAYRRIFNTIPAGILLLDEMNRIIEINHNSAQYLNIFDDKIFDTPIESLLPPDHPVLGFILTPDCDHVEISLSTRTLYLTKSLLSGIHQERIGKLILFTDITRQKEADLKIQENELILRSTFDSTTDGIVIFDHLHRVIASNKKFWEMCTIPDMAGSISDEQHLSDKIHELTDFIDSVHVPESPTGMHDPKPDVLVFRNGKVLERYTSPLMVNGEISGNIWTFHDITELKEKERSLRDSEAKYKHLLDNAPDLIWQLDCHGNFIYVSPSWTRILGYAVESIIGLNFRDIVHQDDRSFCEEYLINSIAQCELRPGIEYRVRHADGTWHWHYGSLIISFGPESDQVSVIGTSRDINNVKIAEKSLKNANRQINLLTSITRHDILNEVTIMYGYLDIAQNLPKSPEIEKVFNVFKKVIPTIQSQIEFTSIFETLGSHEPFWQHIATFLHKKRSPATIFISEELESYEICADPLLERVFDNLLENSIRHGEHVSEIRISCRVVLGDLEIVYQDNGVGISNKEKGNIFKRGYGKNTGMGLFLVREVLQLTGITICETGEYGTGVRFIMLVPAESYRTGAQ